MEHPLISGIACDSNQAKLHLLGIPSKADVMGQVFNAIHVAGIDVDVIVQTHLDASSTVDIAFTVQRQDYRPAFDILAELKQTLQAQDVQGNDRVAKLSIVGVGVRSQLGVASRMFTALAEVGANMHLVSTSEIKISAIIDEHMLEKSANLLHDTFELVNKRN